MQQNKKIGKLCDISWWRAVSKDLPSPQNPQVWETKLQD